MKKFLLPLLLALPLLAPAESVTLGGTEYEVTTLADHEIGPGIRHTRFRLPGYPLNINVLRVDLNNPYNRIETTTANENSRGTESLVSAARRQSYQSHRALAGANANFWVVSSQPEGAIYTGITRNASVRNGQIVTESNQFSDQWDGGTMRTGVVSVSTDKVLNIDYCKSFIHVTNDKFGTCDVYQVNKGVRPIELGMYNRFYGTAKPFMPVKVEGNVFSVDNEGDATEVILDLNEGQSFASNTDIVLTVKEVRLNKGKGTLGNHDVALVGRATHATKLAMLEPGDQVTLSYSWTYNPGTETEVTPQVEQAVGGNALVMRNGELTAHNSNETYNSQVYSRTGYGCSADGKMLYIIVIDKSTDSRFGSSVGCNTAKMCEFARWLGCTNMSNFDAGGSAEMFIEDRIENTTTEASPRAVANGWLIYSIAPEDADDYNVVTRLEFEDYILQSPVYASYEPVVRAYNRYGAVIDRNFKDFILSCPPELGTCNGTLFTAAGTGASGDLTASYGNVSVSKPMQVVDTQMSMRIKNLLIDAVREYKLEVTSTIDKTVYTYEPSAFEWTLSNPEIAEVDASGTLRGLKEGTSELVCKIGDFQDVANLNVQIAPTPTIGIQSWAGWTPKKSSGITDVVVSEDGLISYNYGSPRDPYAGLEGRYDFYSIPDAITLQFTSTVPVRSVLMDIRSALHTRNNNITLTTPDGEPFAANVMHTVNVPLSEFADVNDIASYPISVCGMNFKVTMDAANKGAQTVKINDLYASYNNYASLESIGAPCNELQVSPNPVSAGATFRLALPQIVSVDIFSTSGILVNSTLVNGDVAELTAPSIPGVYVLRINSDTIQTSAILVVK